MKLLELLQDAKKLLDAAKLEISTAPRQMKDEITAPLDSLRENCIEVISSINKYLTDKEVERGIEKAFLMSLSANPVYSGLPARVLNKYAKMHLEEAGLEPLDVDKFKKFLKVMLTATNEKNLVMLAYPIDQIKSHGGSKGKGSGSFEEGINYLVDLIESPSEYLKILGIVQDRIMKDSNLRLRFIDQYYSIYKDIKTHT